jgi:hypothetical protein
MHTNFWGGSDSITPFSVPKWCMVLDFIKVYNFCHYFFFGDGGGGEGGRCRIKFYGSIWWLTEVDRGMFDMETS